MKFTIESGDRLRAVCATCGKEAQWFYRGLDNDSPVIEIVCACGQVERSRLSPGSVGFHHAPFETKLSEVNHLILQLVRYCKKMAIKAAAGRAMAMAASRPGWEGVMEVTESQLAPSIGREYQPLEAALVDGGDLRSAIQVFLQKHPTV